MDTSAIERHKLMAMGEPLPAGGDFGCQTLASTTRGGSGRGAMPDEVQQFSSLTRPMPGGKGLGAETMKDGARAAPVRHSRGISQANPDHGPYA